MEMKLIGKTIGEGGMAVIKEYSKDLVIKFSKPGKENALLEEISLMNTSKELHINPKIIEHGQDYYIMKKYKSDLLFYINSNRETLKFQDLLKISIDIAEKIKKLHSIKILHRDIKPQNILINDINDIVLADFGIAIIHDLPRHTELGLIKGSIMDKANIAFGRATVISNNSHHTDLYAFGMTMLFIFNNKANNFILSIYERCTTFKLEDRFQDFDTLIKELKRHE